MCFSPQRRAISQHLNFKKWSEPDMFCTFSLENVLLATAACNFSFLLWPHDSAPAALTSLLFDSPDTRIIEKTQHFATSLTFGADVSSFFWLSRNCIFFLLTLLHLICFFICFSTLHIVGSLLFKLPSNSTKQPFFFKSPFPLHFFWCHYSFFKSAALQEIQDQIHSTKINSLKISTQHQLNDAQPPGQPISQSHGPTVNGQANVDAFKAGRKSLKEASFETPVMGMGGWLDDGFWTSLGLGSFGTAAWLDGTRVGKCEFYFVYTHVYV